MGDGEEEDSGEAWAESQVLNPGLYGVRRHFCDFVSGDQPHATKNGVGP